MKRNGLIGGLALLITLVLICTALRLPASAHGISTDLSRPASAHNKTQSAADVVEYFLGEKITDAEREYLEKHGGVSISADFGVTTAYVLTEYSDGTLSVKAREYVYTTADGREVRWIPSVLHIGEDSFPLIPGEDDYRATVTRELSGDASCTVDFTLSLSIPTEEVNRILNLAYNDLPRVKAEVEAGYAEYDRLSREYEAGIIAHEEYLLALSKYEADFAAYTEYVSAKKIYDDKKREFDEYILALAEYDNAVEREAEYKLALEKYNADLLAYNEYMSAFDIYRVKLAEYEEYSAKIKLVAEQLAALDAFFVPMTDERTAAGAINGGLVTTILEENRDLFESSSFGIPACLIDDAALATKNLRLLLADYSGAQTEEEKYQVYINSYEAFRDNTVLLLQSLDELYNNDRVRAGIQAKDLSYPRKYEILVSQLVIIANALSDESVQSYWAVYHDTKCTASCTIAAHRNNRYVFTEDTKIHKTSVKDMLGGNPYLSDNGNAIPLAGGVPEATERPTEPERVDKPIKPTAPTVPAKPSEVKNPGEPPSLVEKPTEPIKVIQPEKPTEYIPPSEAVALIDLYNRGGVEKREEVDGECVFVATSCVTKSIFNVSTVTVFFYSESGELIYATSVDRGTRADFVGDLPEKAEDVSATYTFSHWSDGGGRAADLSAVDTDLALYPSFDANLKTYDVTFNVDGVKTVIPTLYGSMPVFDGVAERPDDEYFEYTFAGWDRTPETVVGPAEYTAVFEGRYILPLGIGGAKITFTDDYIFAECGDPFTTAFDLSGLIKRATEKGSARGIILDTGLFDITFSYGTLLEMAAVGDCYVALNRTKVGEYSSYFSVRIGDGEYRISVKLPCSLATGRQLRFYHLGENGEKIPTVYSLSDGILNATVTSGTAFHLAEEYELSYIENPLVTLSVAVDTVARGSRVDVAVDIPDGISLDRLYLVYPNGDEVDINGYSFLMPDSDVTVCASASKIRYEITFMSADKIISVRHYYYGEEITPPPAPTRPSDDDYRYYFVDWSEKFAVVTGDKVYYALYEKVPITAPKEDDGLRISDGVLGILVLCGAGAFLLVFAVIPASVCAIVFARRDRKIRKKAGSNVNKN